ncbi:hypothetical protein HaLaN_05220, partial [Haematococcus lacustris]
YGSTVRRARLRGAVRYTLPTWAAKQRASSDHQRKPLHFLLAYCHMCPRTNHSGEMGPLGTGSVTLRGAESKLGHGVE